VHDPTTTGRRCDALAQHDKELAKAKDRTSPTSSCRTKTVITTASNASLFNGDRMNNWRFVPFLYFNSTFLADSVNIYLSRDLPTAGAHLDR
jgi:hypothetical protein